MSSLLYLGFSIIAFLVSFGIAFMLIPMILGPFFTVDVGELDPEWQGIRDQVNSTAQWIPNIAMMVGLFIFVIKVLMTAAVRGRD